MNLYLLILAILLLIGVVTLIFFFGYTTSKNISQSGNGQILAFAARVDPTNVATSFNDTPLTGTNSTGQQLSQITCPAGTSINIIGALADLYDPYGECTSEPSPAFVASCDPTQSAGTCSSNADCFDNTWFCNAGGQCQLKGNTSVPTKNPGDTSVLNPADCQSPSTIDATSGACMDPNICYNLNSMNQNSMCMGNNCATRDASAYVSAKCNGQTSCNITMAEFGPVPCTIGLGSSIDLPSSGGYADLDLSGFRPTPPTSTPSYFGLPLTYGWNGYSFPNYGQNNGSPTTPTINIGYKVHGIYTCIPNNE